MFVEYLQPTSLTAITIIYFVHFIVVFGYTASFKLFFIAYIVTLLLIVSEITYFNEN